MALVLDRPAGDEVNGVRRALGDGSLARIAPHLTLVPPLNVAGAALPEALAVMRRAAAAAGPLKLTLGPVETFAPANPVLYLAVGGDLERLRALRQAVFAPPLTRPLAWPWVPHVTVCEDAAPERISSALAALDRYALAVDVERVTMLEEVYPTGGPDARPARTWVPIADAALAPPWVVGTGGLPLELARSTVADPEAQSLMAAAGAEPPAGGGSPAGTPLPPVVITARREGAVVGVAGGWWEAGGLRIAVVVARGVRHQGIGRHLLAALGVGVGAAGGDVERAVALGPAAFYRACGLPGVTPAEYYPNGTDE